MDGYLLFRIYRMLNKCNKFYRAIALDGILKKKII